MAWIQFDGHPLELMSLDRNGFLGFKGLVGLKEPKTCEKEMMHWADCWGTGLVVITGPTCSAGEFGMEG